ncbi:nitrilase [Gammaproteobacteria bacterium 45_16_T64]|nr:nitrilase [Gammaproteobacteria bacterium 45_16_T64]
MNIQVAITQKPPVLLDLSASIEKAVSIIEECAAEGAQLIVFPEAYLPGYPSWVWRLRPGGDIGLGNRLHTLLRKNSVDLSANGLVKITEAAAQYNVVVVMGLNEIDSTYSGTTLYNTVVIIDNDGKILNRHRKLMPTNPERMVWGCGDGSGLKVVDTACGRLATLICWESYMPLARFALYSQNVDIYIAPTWDSGKTWLDSMNFISREAGCWVLSTATALQASDIPADFPDKDLLFPEQDEWINPGDAVIIKPFGGVEAGPLHQEKEVLYHTIDVDAAASSRKSLDVSGHYNRPDIFQLEVNRKQQPPISFVDE